jgi:DNA-binding transcriptional ArsR family regulator
MHGSDDGFAAATARVHRALASPVRVALLRLIEAGPRSVSELARARRLSVSMASRHLAALATGGLIVRERNGAWTVQRLTPAGAAALRQRAGGAGGAPSSGVVADGGYDAEDLSALPEEDVAFALCHGLHAFAAGLCDRGTWLDRLARDLGRQWRPGLPTLWRAAMRLYRGESLEGLALPPAIRAHPPAPPALRPAVRALVPPLEDP